MVEHHLETVGVNGLSRISRSIYVLWALLFLFPITALAQESALTGGSEEPQKETPAADKNSTVDSNKKQGEKSDDWSDIVELLLNPTPLITALYIVFFIVVLILGGLQQIRRNKERTLALNTWATENGFEFSPTQDDELLAKMQVFPLFNKGQNRRMINVVKTKTDNVKMTFFQYSYVVNISKGRRDSSRLGFEYAVVAFEHNSLNLPKFTLRPTGGLLDKFDAALVKAGNNMLAKMPYMRWGRQHPIETHEDGFKDIGFDEHPEFSKSFALKGEDEPAMRIFSTGRSLISLPRGRRPVLKLWVRC